MAAIPRADIRLPANTTFEHLLWARRSEITEQRRYLLYLLASAERQRGYFPHLQSQEHRCQLNQLTRSTVDDADHVVLPGTALPEATIAVVM